MFFRSLLTMGNNFLKSVSSKNRFVSLFDYVLRNRDGGWQIT